MKKMCLSFLFYLIMIQSETMILLWQEGRLKERERERETKKTHENYCTFNFIFEKLNFVIFRSVDLRFEKVAFASAGLE